MSAQHAEQRTGVVYPAKTLDGITRTLVANANADVIVGFEDALGCAWAAAKLADTLTPLHNLIETWWPQAMFWADREDALRILADCDDIMRNGMGNRPRHGREQVLAMMAERASGA